MPGCRNGKIFIGRPCKKRSDDLLKLGRHQIKMAAIFTGHAPVKDACVPLACLTGIHLAGSVGWRLKQYSTSHAAASHWLVSVIMFLRNCLLNQKK